MTLILTSSAFRDGGVIPARFTCDGEEVNPPLSISGVPEGTKTLALIMDDPDVPKALLPDGVFDHWILFNIPPETHEIAAGVTVGITGISGAGKNEYIGPCPPVQYEPSEHRYFFTLYALDTTLPLLVGSSKREVFAAMQGHMLARAELMGKYKRP
ncbi:YbhB/YbcL family Raf kinase inhibitor-like protein [Candidatus Kaiserbacteria bacterium CG10_big_fil_rev_8_21_14_0_10_51_14]|uniref:YbhB/YbcL family Raf kinase inhibitor-like protein n=1 Tax=Candidatus Kaiserbacteria bacterium CG10_big_fil_rev_8_21_14_0_10_51_14 TaxID=1974610 RepID=A0A2H0UCH3_9BACT|nr:MAG: YbhB/YbcL family Raf kinase inhibitor-like protein [Candidatus Kaiserbacteria bacterium CG10_big_fil_rev_8_21_14_0_10_51_14]